MDCPDGGSILLHRALADNCAIAGQISDQQICKPNVECGTRVMSGSKHHTPDP